MKKIIALAVALLLLLGMTACDSTAPANTNPPSADSPDSIQNAEAQQTTTATEAPQADFQEVTVVDNAYCTIKITGLDPDNMWGYTLKAYLENKSSDKTYMFSLTSASINNVQTNPLFAADVAAGKKATEDIAFSDGILDEVDIGKYADIELNFRVYDSNDWTAEPVATPSIHIYPYGEEQAAQFVREPAGTDTVLVDNDSVTVIVTGYEKDDIWGYTANLYLMNKTEVPVMFSVDEASVNGYMADPFFATSVEAGKCAFNSISWSNTTLEENGITEVENIEFNLRAYNSDDWMADDFVNETVTLHP